MSQVVQLLALMISVLSVFLVLNLAKVRYPEFFKERGIEVTPFSVLVKMKADKLTNKLSSLARRRAVGLLLDVGVAVFALSMLLGYQLLLTNLATMVKTGSVAVKTVPILPGITISWKAFLYLLAVIPLSIVVHELAHAVAALHEGVGIRSAGAGLLFFIPLGFVEIDEEKLESLRLRSKARILSAGVAANAALFIVALLALTLIGQSVVVASSLRIVGVIEGSPAQKAGVPPGSTLLAINGTKIATIEDLREVLSKTVGKECNLVLSLSYNGSIENITVHKPASTRYIGIEVVQNSTIIGAKPPLNVLPTKLIIELIALMNWLLLINYALAVINALPLFISDGSRMVRYALSKISPSMPSLAIDTVTSMLLVLSIVFSVVK